ncbi:DUF935 family protein [Mucilaginibacter sp. RCC_168]|uniref:phage portal protein family protein n=1 Tax=Mucilaginibacter sp. RCC_168 TaxID=3239221 RepID=UPI003523AC12
MSIIQTAYKAVSGYIQLAADKYSGVQKQGTYLPHDLKSVAQTRVDIKDWKRAEAIYYNQYPKTWPLQLIFNNTMKDALLSSQVENRLQRLLSLDFRLLKPDGEVDTEQTKALKAMPLTRYLTRKSFEKILYEYSVVELSMAQTVDGRRYMVADEIPRTNIVPITGEFYPDYTNEANKIDYRDMPEFGTWVLEFWNKEMPLLNKVVPDVLFMRFAQSCWSELCEIFGIPPRVLKTNTQDKKMMERAQKMMKDMGAASWFIIDEEESFEFAEATNSNGDVYNGLISLCSNRICMAIMGVILGQDTKNGNRSKEEVAQDMAKLLTLSDMATVAEDWNTVILPALVKHGFVKGDLTFEFVPTENIAQLLEWIVKLLEYYEIDPEWIAEKTGIKITKARETPLPSKSNNAQNQKLKADLLGDDDFFGQARRRSAA